MNSSSKKKRITLLNPPSKRPVLRDYYCSTYPKARYLWQPIDLLAMGALLQERAELQFIDAVAERLSDREVINRIEEFNPNGILAMVSSLTKDVDLSFIQQFANNERLMAITGEVALEFDFDEYPFIDGLMLDFTSESAARYLLGNPASGRVRTRTHEPTIPPKNEEFTIGKMPHLALPHKSYRMPYWRKDFFSLLTNFGCPHSCKFCNSGLHCLGYKLRSLKDISNDAEYLKQIGAERIYIRDMTFGADRNHSREVLNILSKYEFDLHAFIHASTIDHEFATALSSAGLSLAQIGIETPIESSRKTLGKNLSDEDLYSSFDILKKAGIPAGCHFIVGMEGEPEDIIKRCTNMASKLDAVYCSINVYQPRSGTTRVNCTDDERLQLLSRRAKLAMLKYNGIKELSRLCGF